MRGFWFGCLAGILAIMLSAFLVLRFGLVDPRADIAINTVEKSIAMPAMDAAVDRHAPPLADPVAGDEVNLQVGLKIYEDHCALCHGDAARPHAALADSLYPRPPQFAADAPDMKPYENFYIIQHGIRLTGMPGWQTVLSPQEMWQVTTYLAHMDAVSSMGLPADRP